MELNRVLIVYKGGVGRRPRQGGSSAALRRLERLGRQHRGALETVRDCLDAIGIRHRTMRRRQLRGDEKADLILTIGGDGTFLAAAHCAGKTPILGINSMPGHSVGFFCTATVDDLCAQLDAIARGKRTPKQLPLIEARIGRRVLSPLAVNDILFATAAPAEMARYTIDVGKGAEMQRSSGVWIAAGPGSTAAIRSAGGRRQALTAARLQYLVREPYRSPLHVYRFVRGLLPKGSAVTITSHMEGAIVSIDGPEHTVPLPFGERLTARIAQQHLNVFL